MIIDVWRPRIKKRVVYSYERTDIEVLYKKQPLGWRFTYRCDRCGKISNMNTKELYRKDNTLTSENKQYCRSCRTWLIERKRNNAVDFDKFVDILKGESYKIYTTKEEFDDQYRSQANIKVKCGNGHEHNVTWNNFNKGKRCRFCYEEKRTEESINNLYGFDLYKRMVCYFTYKSIKQCNIKDIEKRGRKWHLDHKFSIANGFKGNIPPYIIGNYYNLEMLYYRDNLSKYSSSSITKGELFDGYFKEI